MGLLTVNYANILNANVDNVNSNSIASNSTHQQAQPTVVMETVLSTTTVAPLSIADKENRFGDVFEGLGHMPGKLHLDVDESQTPVVMPPRRVPIALKAKLKAELERLENLHVIQKVTSPTDWVSNLVIAEKPNGKLRPRSHGNAIVPFHFCSSFWNGKVYCSHGNGTIAYRFLFIFRRERNRSVLQFARQNKGMIFNAHVHNGEIFHHFDSSLSYF